MTTIFYHICPKKGIAICEHFALAKRDGLEYNLPICRCGGIGRRPGLKIPCPQGRAGSTPATGTTSPRTTYRSRRLFYKSHLSLILSRLLSKSQPLPLGCDLVLGANSEVSASSRKGGIDLSLQYKCIARRGLWANFRYRPRRLPSTKPSASQAMWWKAWKRRFRAEIVLFPPL